jgi:AhpD family alkylhydroperoxidase
MEKKTKRIRIISLAVAAAATLTLASHAHAEDPAAATMTEIQRALGFVPTFIARIPHALLPGWWDQTKALEMNPKSALNGKTKELLGLAVAAQIPCDQCVLFHTEMARLNGASDQEIQEAIGMAALTRFGSTLMHGLQIDRDAYRQDVSRLVKNAREAARKEASRK